MRALTSRALRSSRSSSLVKGASSEYRWEDAHWRKHGRAPGSSPTFGRITEEREDTIFEWEVDAPINYLCTLRASNDALAHPRLCPHTRRTSFYQRLAAMQICEWTFRVLGLARLPARHHGSSGGRSTVSRDTSPGVFAQGWTSTSTAMQGRAGRPMESRRSSLHARQTFRLFRIFVRCPAVDRVRPDIMHPCGAGTDHA